MMQSFTMMGLVTILWAIVGYSLAFGHGNWFIGASSMCSHRSGLAPNTDYATIPSRPNGLPAHVRHHTRR